VAAGAFKAALHALRSVASDDAIVNMIRAIEVLFLQCHAFLDALTSAASDGAKAGTSSAITERPHKVLDVS
jgi:hypothetical protein